MVRGDNHDREERRRDERTVIEKPAEIELEDSAASIFGLVLDVSTTGMSLVTDRPIEVGTQVTVRATLDGDKHGVQGRTVRVQEHEGTHWIVGIQYDLLTLEEDPFMFAALRKRIVLR